MSNILNHETHKTESGQLCWGYVFKLKAKATKFNSIWINYLIKVLSVNVTITNEMYQKSINSASFTCGFQDRQHFLFVSGLYCYLLLWPAALALVEVAEHRSGIWFTINLCRDASLKCYFARLLLSIVSYTHQYGKWRSAAQHASFLSVSNSDRSKWSLKNNF